jgi:hypothetical protein
MGNADARMTADLFLDIASSLALGIVEMQMQFATGSTLSLLNTPIGQSLQEWA